ncbi:hypothetical protein BU17DRAFT_43933 [Hysterangium stoloniferum]|nr:hypothetical protein BU17DRAFT_43933 [Hysterangium stoloniferum]
MATPPGSLPPPLSLPNPETPLAFLPPTLASQFEVSRYLLVATCGMFSWDLLTNLRNDYKLLTQHRISAPTLVYFLSRYVSFSYIICSTAFQIGPVGNCQTLQIAVGWTFAMGVGSTALLFLFRVLAIFNNDVWITIFFTFMWLATLGGSMTVPFAITGAHIGPTDHCINTGVKPFSSVGIIVSTVNDTLVFIFISIRLLQTTSYQHSLSGRAKSFFGGEGLPVFSRMLLQSGQEYYLVTVGGNILTMVLILAPASLPAVYHAMCTVPNMAIANAMACRVYRDVKFGRIGSGTSAGGRTTAASSFPSFATPRNNSSNTKYGNRKRQPYETETGTEFTGATASVLPVQVTKTVYHESDVPMEVMFPDGSEHGSHIKSHGINSKRLSQML